MEKLSVAIITLNEEKNIERCITSVEGLADEIVVIDSFSTDKTKAICRKFNVKFETHPFEGYIQQKQYALSTCNYNYVLSLDADEALSERLKAAIMLEKETGFRYSAYTMNRLSNYCGQWIRHCGWYPDVKLRLFDKTLGAWGGQNPHDKFVLYNRQQKAVHLEGDIFHFSYYAIDEHYKQASKFAGIAANELSKKGKRSSILYATMKTGVKFFRNYLLKAGFLDGRNGFIISKISALETWWKYTRLIQLNKIKKANESA